ncbi:uncharacterized protein LOC144754987 isoform X3 [Lissotriton helveticus]
MEKHRKQKPRGDNGWRGFIETEQSGGGECISAHCLPQRPTPDRNVLGLVIMEPLIYNSPCKEGQNTWGTRRSTSNCCRTQHRPAEPLSRPPEHELSDADSLHFSDEEHKPDPSRLPGRTTSQAPIVPTTTATTLALTPDATTCAASITTTTTTACNTLPASVITNTTTQSEEGRESLRVHRLPTPQIRDNRAGGRVTGGKI